MQLLLTHCKYKYSWMRCAILSNLSHHTQRWWSNGWLQAVWRSYQGHIKVFCVVFVDAFSPGSRRRCSQTLFVIYSDPSFRLQRNINTLLRLIGNVVNLKKLGPKICPQIFWMGKNVQMSDFDREYLQNGTRYRQQENGVANYKLSRRWRNLVNFGPQTAKQ